MDKHRKIRQHLEKETSIDVVKVLSKEKKKQAIMEKLLQKSQSEYK